MTAPYYAAQWAAAQLNKSPLNSFSGRTITVNRQVRCALEPDIRALLMGLVRWSARGNRLIAKAANSDLYLAIELDDTVHIGWRLSDGSTAFTVRLNDSGFELGFRFEHFSFEAYTAPVFEEQTDIGRLLQLYPTPIGNAMVSDRMFTGCSAFIAADVLLRSNLDPRSPCLVLNNKVIGERFRTAVATTTMELNRGHWPAVDAHRIWPPPTMVWNNNTDSGGDGRCNNCRADLLTTRDGIVHCTRCQTLHGEEVVAG